MQCQNYTKKLYDAVSTLVAGSRDALSTRPENIRNTVAFYYNKVRKQVFFCKLVLEELRVL